ncbi:hypothetical protein H4R21_005701 [Coemansia helicoidea]|uniref:Uncharacterized protein n=1 Tax=Coemansia helicoidea TaxID=1286919 RepID=A0ACC1KS22_9FUNG|nr:hypothetical protein H4R21_005701 [Coemansia helicoidea]
MNPVEMDLDSPPRQDGAAAEPAGRRVRPSAPFTPPASTGTTPQRAGGSGRRGAGRAGGSGLGGMDSDSDSDSGRRRGFGRHGNPAEADDETGKIEHEDFYDNFGNEWSQPA